MRAPSPGALSACPDFETIDIVTCIGAGTIGGGWAGYFFAQGFQVKAWNPDPDAGEKLTRLIDAVCDESVIIGSSTSSD